jgi:hypothetical protein
VLEAVNVRLGLTDEQDQLLYPLLEEELRKMQRLAAAHMRWTGTNYASFLRRLRDEDG